MMAYEPQPQNEYQETSTELKIATAVFVAVAAWQVADQISGISSMAAWDWIILYRAAAIGLFAGGSTYAILLVIVAIAPGLPALLLQKAEDVTGLDLDGKPQPKWDLPTGQPKREPRRRSLEVEPLPLEEAPSFEDAAVTIPAAPEWEQRVDAMNYDNGRMLINGQLVELSEDFEIAWLYVVAEKRAAGMLETISTIKLNQVEISRWGDPISPAAMVIELLENTGCVKSRGVNQPYDWTDAGKLVFPSPTD